MVLLNMTSFLSFADDIIWNDVISIISSFFPFKWLLFLNLSQACPPNRHPWNKHRLNRCWSSLLFFMTCDKVVNQIYPILCHTINQGLYIQMDRWYMSSICHSGYFYHLIFLRVRIKFVLFCLTSKGYSFKLPPLRLLILYAEFSTSKGDLHQTETLLSNNFYFLSCVKSATCSNPLYTHQSLSLNFQRQREWVQFISFCIRTIQS